MSLIDDLRDKIEDYRETIFAILGFINFYRYDDDSQGFREDVVVFQGLRLTPSPAKATTADGNTIECVTPDFGIIYEPGRGVLGEAKKSFPRDRAHWIDVFKQVMAYDDDLAGWPCPEEMVESHDVVLLTHQSRVVDVYEYYEEQVSNGQISFVRPFSVISFNRSQERRPYIHFEKRLGTLSHPDLDERLRRGVPVPMSAFAGPYSTVKLYDAEPPLPYMMWIIWEYVVEPHAAEDPKFRGLRWNQKIQVTLDVRQIVTELQERYSFRQISPKGLERQPDIPRHDWCARASDALVEAGMAEWAAPDSRARVTFHFNKLSNTLDHMLTVCAEQAPSRQLPLFQETASDGPAGGPQAEAD